jgi:chloramphenicol 3-O-phosphotransferase
MDTVFLNGTVGSGKSTLASALSALEVKRPHAVIDLDEIRRLRPKPRADRFNHQIELQNLRSLAANYRAAGAEYFILAGVIEERAEGSKYVDALGSNGMFICRLVASPEVLSQRLVRRHDGDPEELRWHLARAGELAQILESISIDHLVLDSSQLTVSESAGMIRREVGWD